MTAKKPPFSGVPQGPVGSSEMIARRRNSSDDGPALALCRTQLFSLLGQEFLVHPDKFGEQLIVRTTGEFCFRASNPFFQASHVLDLRQQIQRFTSHRLPRIKWIAPDAAIMVPNRPSVASCRQAHPRHRGRTQGRANMAESLWVNVASRCRKFPTRSDLDNTRAVPNRFGRAARVAPCSGSDAVSPCVLTDFGAVLFSSSSFVRIRTDYAAGRRRSQSDFRKRRLTCRQTQSKVQRTWNSRKRATKRASLPSASDGAGVRVGREPS